ncbi:acyl-CoA dehydrogenase family protein [Streptomyces sp. NPDC003943]
MSEAAATGSTGSTATDRTGLRTSIASALDRVAASGETATVWRELGRAGVLRALGPSGTAPGGTADPLALEVLLTELDARHPTGTVLSACVQLATALPIMAEGLGSDLVRSVYESTLDGEAQLALATTDSGAGGSDLMEATTVAELGEDQVVLNGGKRWITNATTAGHALVLARHRPARHFTSFVWVLVPTDAPGVTVEPTTTRLFLGSGVGDLRFDGVTVGREHVVGRPGRALPSFARHIGTERLASALWARAICRRVLDRTRERLAGHPLHGRTAWDNDAVRARFAKCLVELRRMDALCATIQGGPDERPTALDGMIAKAAVAESLQYVVGECVQLQGAAAFADDGIAHLHTEAAAWSIAGGATGAMLAGVADHATDVLKATR